MVRRLGCYCGIAELTAPTLAAEVADFRRFGSAPAFMGFTGLAPSEYSSGARTPPGRHHQGRPGRAVSCSMMAANRGLMRKIFCPGKTGIAKFAGRSGLAIWF